jgi:hypothetical protein
MVIALSVVLFMKLDSLVAIILVICMRVMLSMEVELDGRDEGVWFV